jgi:hypothetical protein
MRLRLTEQDIEDLYVALYDAIEYEKGCKDVWDNVKNAEGNKIRRKLDALIKRYSILRKKIRQQFDAQKHRRKAR